MTSGRSDTGTINQTPGTETAVLAGVPDAGTQHARLASDQVLHAPETPAGQDGRLGSGHTGDLTGVVDAAGHDASPFESSVVSNSGRYSP